MKSHGKIYLAVGAAFVLILVGWVVMLPYTFSQIRETASSKPVDPALAEVRLRIREFRNALKVVPSFPSAANATVSDAVLKSLEAKLKATASSSRP